ncbi:MAG: Nramp family divalent metal transporter [Gaiellaceae bacterium]
MMATRAEEGPRLPGAGERVLQGQGRWRLLPFLGPAFIACVAYIDPGNFATNIAAGSKFGFTLVWVIVASNLMAMLIQTLSAKLGIATGRNLPEVCRERFSRKTSIGLWIQAEFIAMATDLAEFLGAALGIQLLLGIPLFPAAVITGVITLLILGLQRYGFRPLEAVITAFVFVIGICYLGELYFAHPPLGTVAKHAVGPEFAGNESVLLAVGIIGATVMPHVIYLHSALTQQRIVPRNDEEAKTLFRYTRIDVLIAMVIAGLINISMLVVAATVFYGSGLLNVDSLEGAHRTLEPILGGASSVLFALALTASGLSSSTVGTMSGQVVMQGFIQRQIPVAVRRLVTMIPAFVVIGIGVDPSRTLVISQVVLSFGIPFALIPLVVFTARRDVMGPLVNRRSTTIAASAIATLIVALNIFLLLQTFAVS